MNTTSQASAKSLQECALQIEGMMCAGCAAAVAATLQRQPGVSEASVNFAADAAVVRWDPEKTSLEQLQKATRKAGYRIHPAGDEGAGEHSQRFFRIQLQVRLAVAVCFGIWSMMAALVLYLVPQDMLAPGTPWYLALASGVLALPVLLYSGSGFYKAGWRTLRAGVPGMDTLITLAVISATAVSIIQLIRGSEDVYFDAAVMLISFQLIARLIDLTVRRNATRAVHAYLGALPERARRHRQGEEQDVALAELEVDDAIRIAPGETIPVDGVVLRGHSSVQRALITGESGMQACAPNDQVLAGTGNGEGELIIRVSAGAGKRRIDALARSVRELLSSKSALQRITDRLARALLPIVLIAAAAAAVLALGSHHSFSDAATRALAVLIVTCPCALSLAVPLVGVLTLSASGRKGVIFRDPAVLETAARARTVILDKTGTLTRDHPEVSEVEPVAGVTANKLQEYAAEAMAGSHHPLLRSLTSKLGHEPSQPEAGAQQILPGRGSILKTERHILHAGRARWLNDQGITIPDHADLGTEICVARDGVFIGRIRFTESVRPEARIVLDELRQLDCEIHMVSGDSRTACYRIAEELGIDRQNVTYGQPPEDKLARIQNEQSHHPTLFVGDGQNDGPALAAAELGLAVGEADPTARAAAAALLPAGLLGVPDAIRMARTARRGMFQNLGWALAYNLLALPAAVLGYVHPAIAAAAMGTSTLCVLGNCARLGLTPEIGKAPRTHALSPDVGEDTGKEFPRPLTSS